MPAELNLTGQRFGKLVAIEKVQSRSRKTYWLCQCDCGNFKEIQTCHLTMEITKSCGKCWIKPNVNSIDNTQNANKKVLICPICKKEYASNNISRKYCYECSPVGRNGKYTVLLHAMKSQIIKERGGKCELCGYDACEDALCFHHIDPAQKEFNLATQSGSCNWEKYQRESKKCMLLCMNCHVELHKKLREADELM